MTEYHTDNSFEREIHERKLAYVLRQNDKLVSKQRMQTKKQQIETQLDRYLRKTIVTTGFVKIRETGDREQAILVALTSATGMAEFQLRNYLTYGYSSLHKEITTMIHDDTAYAIIDAHWK